MRDPCGGDAKAAPKSPQFIPSATTAPVPAKTITGIREFAYYACVYMYTHATFLSSFDPIKFHHLPRKTQSWSNFPLFHNGPTTKKVTDGWGGSRHLRVVNSFAWCDSWRYMTSSINFLTLTSKPNLTGEGGGAAEIHSKGPGKIGLKLLHNVTFIWFYFFQIYNISGLRFTPFHYITLSSSMTITPITTSNW